MKTSLDEFVSILDRINSRLDELEGRVEALEHALKLPDVAGVKPAQEPATQQLALEPASRLPSVMAVVGRAFLGIAGAYVLRALAEAGSVPQWMVVGFALVYAGTWLILSARTKVEAGFASAAYATTAAIILSPMLWELTLRFRVMPARVTALALIVFVGAAQALAWKGRLLTLIWPPVAFAALTAAILLVATRDPLPFAIALLAMATLTEVAGVSGRWPSLRPLVALMVDFAVLALILIYTGTRAGFDYRPIEVTTLLALFGASVAVYLIPLLAGTIVRRREIGIFDASQMVVAFALALWGTVRATQENGLIAIGMICALTAAACYVLIFLRFGGAEQQRNYHVFAAWAAALLLVGALCGFSVSSSTSLLGAAALGATLGGSAAGRVTLLFHGAAYLTAMGLISGMLGHAGKLLTGTVPDRASWLVWVASVLTLICYVVIRQTGFSGHAVWEQKREWPLKALRTVFAFLAAAVAMAAAVGAGLLILPGISTSRLASLRTLVICAVALTLVWSGSRLRRTELVWLAYAAIAFCTLKLLFEDLRNGNAGTMAFSLFCCGMAWLLVPRFARRAKTPPV